MTRSNGTFSALRGLRSLPFCQTMAACRAPFQQLLTWSRLQQSQTFSFFFSHLNPGCLCSFCEIAFRVASVSCQSVRFGSVHLDESNCQVFFFSTASCPHARGSRFHGPFVQFFFSKNLINVFLRARCISLPQLSKCES